MTTIQGVDETGQVTAVAVDEDLANAAGAAPIEVSIKGGAIGGQVVTLPPSTAVSSSALEASRVLKSSAGTFRSLTVMLDASAPTGTYYAQLGRASATVPANGAVTLLRPPLTITHLNGAADFATFDEGDAGIEFTVGCWTCISSTQFTKTVAGSYALFSGSVV